jgi:hypothetical protein
MGAMNFFGNFLKGYTEARQNKQRLGLAKESENMNLANQWANIADRASGPGGDAIREMATKNMQDIIIKHEKEAGEKHGFSAILKFFKKDKKDAPAVLNQLAPMLSRRIQPVGDQMSTDVQEPREPVTEASMNPDGTVQGYDSSMEIPMPSDENSASGPVTSYTDLKAEPRESATEAKLNPDGTVQGPDLFWTFQCLPRNQPLVVLFLVYRVNR